MDASSFDDDILAPWPDAWFPVQTPGFQFSVLIGAGRQVADHRGRQQGQAAGTRVGAAAAAGGWAQPAAEMRRHFKMITGRTIIGARTAMNMLFSPKCALESPCLKRLSYQMVTYLNRKLHVDVGPENKLSTFFDLVPVYIANSLLPLGIHHPTKVQVEWIPLVTQGRTAAIFAPTGSGKTLSWLLPLYDSLYTEGIEDLKAYRRHKRIRRSTKERTGAPPSTCPQARLQHQLRCLVVVPTRELGSQYVHELAQLNRETGFFWKRKNKKMQLKIDCELFCESLETSRRERMLAKIKGNQAPPLLFATACSLSTILKEVNLETVKHVVIEEADLILSTNARNMQSLLGTVNAATSQFIFVTATPSRELQSFIEMNTFGNGMKARQERSSELNTKSMQDPGVPSVSMPPRTPREVGMSSESTQISTKVFSVQSTPSQLTHVSLQTPTAAVYDKHGALVDFIQKNFRLPVSSPGSVPFLETQDDLENTQSTHPTGIVFADTASDVQTVTALLKSKRVRAESFRSTDHFSHRRNVIAAIRFGELDVIVCTEEMSRGLDLKGLTHVFNISPCATATSYIHRAGRIARVGAWGQGLSPTVTFTSINCDHHGDNSKHNTTVEHEKTHQRCFDSFCKGPCVITLAGPQERTQQMKIAEELGIPLLIVNESKPAV